MKNCFLLIADLFPPCFAFRVEKKLPTDTQSQLTAFHEASCIGKIVITGMNHFGFDSHH